MEVLDRNKINRILLVALFIIYPLGSLPFVFREIYKGKRYAYSLLAIFIGYICMLYPPTGDLYRYTQDYYTYLNLSYSSFRDLLSLKLDYLFSFILWGLGQLNLHCDLSRFLYAYIGSELLFSIFYDQVKSYAVDPSYRRRVFFLFVLLLLYTNFIGLCFRYGFSCALFAYGSYQVLWKKRNKGWIALVIAVLNHFSFLVFFLTVVGCKIIPFKGKRWLAILGIVWMILFSGNIMSDIISILPLQANVVDHLMAYIDGEWAGEFLEEHSLRFRIMLFLNRLGILSLLLIFMCWFKPGRWSGFLNVMVGILAISSFSVTLLFRFEWAAVMPFYIYVVHLLLQKENHLPYRRTFLRLMLGVGCIMLFSALWGGRRQYLISNEYKLLYGSSITILNTSYSLQWLNSHVNEDGSLD